MVPQLLRWKIENQQAHHIDTLSPNKRAPSPIPDTISCTLLKYLPKSSCFSLGVLVISCLSSLPWLPLTVSLLLCTSKAATSSFPLPPSTAVFVADVLVASFVFWHKIEVQKLGKLLLDLACCGWSFAKACYYQ